MTFREVSRKAAAAILFLAVGLGLTSCGANHSIGYVYMAASTTTTSGLIDGYKIFLQNGNLAPLADSPIPAGGRGTIAIVATPDARFLYVVNRDDSNVVFFVIGTDGKIYQNKTYNVTGSFPTAAALDATGKYLLVTFTYQNGPDNTQLYTPAFPGPGGITIFPINADNTLGAPLTSPQGDFFPLGRNPVAIAVTPDNFVYAVLQDPDTTANLFGFSFDPSAANPLTPLAGVTVNSGNVPSTGYDTVGKTPVSVLADASGGHLYVTEQATSQVIGYAIGADGVPTQVGTAPTGSFPAGMAIDLTGKYLFVASRGAGAVNGFTFGPSGEPVVSTTASSVQAGTGANCVTIIGAPTSASPTHAVYMYTSNNLSSNVSGMQLNPNDGSVIQIQKTPWSGSALPACIVSVRTLP
ncbi:MAG: lactonase family protein [Acidobacteriaceae bacterium]|nr:lactonase family protein [Acidobacteriaceae bacterium]